MAPPLRGRPGGPVRSQGKRAVAALNSAKKPSAAKPTPVCAQAMPQATPARIGPSAAEYSTRKRPRGTDADLALEEDDLAPRPAQQRRATVVTPRNLAAECRRVKPPSATRTQTVQITPPVSKLFGPFGAQNSGPTASQGQWRQQAHRLSSPLGYRRPTAGPSGLVNLGNTCYLNAVLQSLFSLPTFPGAVRAAAAATRAAPGGVLSALAGALAQRAASTASGRSAFSPDAVKAAVAARRGAFRGALQHDAHEFFCGLLEAAQAEVLDAEAAAARRPRLRASESVDPVTRVFGFALEHRFKCSACSHESAVVEECTHLSLDLPCVDPKNLTSVPPSLETLLDTYFAAESVEKACEGCGEGCVAHAVVRRVRRMPRVLALHVKRFQVTLGPRGSIECRKLRTPVKLTPGLRMGPFCLDKATMPLPPLQPTQAFEKENLGDNAAKAASRAAAAPHTAVPAAASPAPRHAVAGVRSGTFYNGYHDSMAPPPPPPPGYAVKTFKRKGGGNGAASVDYWDNRPQQKKPVAKTFGDIVGAAASPAGRRGHGGDNEEDAALARALAESAAEEAAKAARELELEDEEFATAIKRSLEQAQAEEAAEAAAAAAAGAGAPGDLEPWMDGAGLSGANNEWAVTQDAETPFFRRKNTAAADANADDAADAEDGAAPLGPIPEIVEDDADLGDAIDSQLSDKDNGVLVRNNALPLVLSGAERMPNALLPSHVRSYRLTAVISHHGPRVESGHFTADAVDPVTSAWHRFNDARVTAINGADAVGPAAQQDCYMLFYSIQCAKPPEPKK